MSDHNYDNIFILAIMIIILIAFIYSLYISCKNLNNELENNNDIENLKE